ncbi:MAG: hypothetical protein HOW73_26100 [Polyangiaceae bacterium]|nr:hypothetical protein [Polyangiaceae bacterium]
MRTLIFASVFGLGAVGCNAIFGITEGTLDDDAGGGGNTVTDGGGGSTGTQGGEGGAPSTGGSPQGGAPTTGGAGGEGGEGGGGPPPICNPDDLADNDVLDDSCGLFVNTMTGTEDGAGTKANPMLDLMAAVEAVETGKNVYICGSPAIVGIFHTGKSAGIYGGLTCDSWQRAPANMPVLSGSATPNPVDIPPTMSVTSNGGVTLQNLTILGPSLANGTAGVEAQSSIAVYIVHGNTTLRRVTAQASAGQKGEDGMAFPFGSAPGPPGQSASAGACLSSGTQGGQNTCSFANVSGGNGGICLGTNGSQGQQGFGPSPGSGGTYNSATQTCTNGGPGGAGQMGQPGEGGKSADGRIQGSGGLPYFPGPLAGGGMDGSAGSGGGGGGSRPGTTGGGGGAGGCGGTGGRGAKSGGASFAVLVAENAVVSIIESTLSSSRGGEGGHGGPGQDGGGFGQGGTGSGSGSSQCNGGNGGPGGPGGGGGGGSGGPTACVAQDGTANITLGADSTCSRGSGGQGGVVGGNASGSEIVGNGDTGYQCNELVLTPDVGNILCDGLPP